MRFLAVILLAGNLSAQEPEQKFDLPLFKDGLYTRFSANVIPDGALTEALNVTLDEDVSGVAVRRRGISKYNTTAITDTKTVRGLWKFDANDGTKYMVALSSQSFYKTSGDGVWAAITGAWSFSATNEFDCTSTLGRLWCLNSSTVFSWDGTSTHTITAAPVGSLIENFRNRVLIAGISGQKGRLRVSGELDGTDWATGAMSTSAVNIAVGGVNDGNEITCLMGAYQDTFIIGKRDSLWGLYGFDRNDFVLRELSREVGCLEDRSVQEKNNCLYWLSKRGVERFCGTSIERVSDPIRDQIDTIVATAGNARSAVDTSQSDFEAGNLTASGPGAPISATISPGNIVPSSITFVDTTDADFIGGTPTNLQYAAGSLSMSTSTVDNFTDGDVTADPAWTQIGTVNVIVSGGEATVGSSSAGAIRTPYTVAIGTFTIDYRLTENFNGNMFKYWFVANDCGTTNGVCDGYLVRIQNVTGTLYVALDLQRNLTECTKIVPSEGAYSCGTSAGTSVGSYDTARHKIKVIRTSGGEFQLYHDSTFIGSGSNAVISTSTRVAIRIDDDGVKVDSITAPSSSGDTVSRSFDSAFSTPTWGTVAVDMSSTTASPLTIQTQVSADNSTWDSLVTQTNGTKITSNAKRYIRYKLNYTVGASSEVPIVNSVTMIGATTGYFIGQCRNPGSAATAWGNFQCNTVANGGTFSFAVSTGSTCHAVTRTTATWNTQGNNSVISAPLSTGFAAYRVLFDLDVGTDAPTVQDCTMNWQEGATRPPVSTAVHRDRYYMAFTTSTASGAANEHHMVLDRNDKWTIFDNISCYSMTFYERKLFCGASTASGQVWQMDVGTDDDGAGFTSRIRTKAYSMGMPEARKTFLDLYLDLEPEPDPSDAITLTGRYRLDRGTTTFSLNTIDLGEDGQHILSAAVPFGLDNPISGRYIQIELESSGLNQPWRLFGGRLFYKPLRRD